MRAKLINNSQKALLLHINKYHIAMKWIEIKGSVGEQMLRYTLALSMNNKGDGVGVTCANEKLFATFPSLK